MSPKNTTQSFIPLKEIRDGVILREDGTYCASVLVSTLNFNLKSTEERTALLFQFQSILNSLENSVQILIQSRRLNIRPYLQFLEELKERQDVELLRLQTAEYSNFIKEFTDLNEIMTKQFFMIVTYTPLNIKEGGIFSKKETISEKTFEEVKGQLLQRVSFLENNIRSLGVRTVRLKTEEVTELLYQTFNPGDTQTPPSVEG